VTNTTTVAADDHRVAGGASERLPHADHFDLALATVASADLAEKSSRIRQADGRSPGLVEADVQRQRETPVTIARPASGPHDLGDLHLEAVVGIEDRHESGPPEADPLGNHAR
jgi:hypothetical protein